MIMGTILMKEKWGQKMRDRKKKNKRIHEKE
jgi:hypothetical protein